MQIKAAEMYKTYSECYISLPAVTQGSYGTIHIIVMFNTVCSSMFSSLASSSLYHWGICLPRGPAASVWVVAELRFTSILTVLGQATQLLTLISPRLQNWPSGVVCQRRENQVQMFPAGGIVHKPPGVRGRTLILKGTFLPVWFIP